ncbi:hypothetical protein D9619_011554 [Psilocybe cf. subviscida]|uniref:Uncharacterized protein n=1 Tax=Psilocybe cf. subviscida TaxID=2480587 RepID=A0A8H5BSU8_9AGAR|nr:hypothetical protein D9619_011554 [Psilocybe cf. subviscida]
MQGILDDNDAVLSGLDERRKDEGEDLPVNLIAQWDKDCKPKVEYKKRKSCPSRSRCRPDTGEKEAGTVSGPMTNIPNCVIDMVTLTQRTRRFVAEICGPKQMSLPPYTKKDTRKKFYEMVVAFHFNSGKGNARCSTLHKTSPNNQRIHEKTGTWIMQQSDD